MSALKTVPFRLERRTALKGSFRSSRFSQQQSSRNIL